MNFREWCECTGHDVYIKLWDYEKNGVVPECISFRSHAKVYIKCPRGIHESTQTNPDHLTTRKRALCEKCNSFGQYIVDTYGEDYLQELWSDKNAESPYCVQKSGTSIIQLRCLENPNHGEYSLKCNTYYTACLAGNTGCPKCKVSGKNGKPARCDSLGEVIPQSATFWAEGNSTDVFSVTPKSNKKARWRCPKGVHADFERSIAESVRYNFRCPLCSSAEKTSMLQRKVSGFLESLGYTVLHEYQCTLIARHNHIRRGNWYLPYDNDVVELKLIIEVNGKQHYEKRSWHDSVAKRNNTTPDYEFKMQHKRDLFKKWYAIEHGYNYLEIPYYLEKDDKYKDAILNKIAEITAKESVTITA